MKPLPDSVRAFVDAARVCRIATVRTDGEPHVIPVCPVYDGDTTLYVDIGPKSTTARALEHEPRITVLIDEYDADWTKLRKVILRCTAEAVTGVAQERVWEQIRTTYPQYASVEWSPRLTMALRISGWLQEGIVSPAH
jgi:nitroimidazol reductase NimA-like FMN-containing flavoprotein (pyridoxamine 5'-phosphate oxidase superfamily)